MPKFLLIFISAVLSASLATAQTTTQISATDCREHTLAITANDSSESKNTFPQTLCLYKSALELNYLPRQKHITLQISRKFYQQNEMESPPPEILTVQRIDPNYQAQSNNLIGWLPRSLQTGLSAKRAYYLFSRSSKSGNPTSQCGSGSEIVLGIIDFSNKQIQQIGELPVSSCLYFIDPADSGSGHIFNAFSASPKGLRIEWMGYSQKLDGSVYGTLAPDAQTFEIHHGK